MKSAVSTPVRPGRLRRRADHDLVTSVARRLTSRDRLLCQVLFDHRVLTTSQVVDLCFTNLTTARHRLTVLYGLRVLDRFRHFRAVGSDPYHYVLDAIGVEVVAADRGIEVTRPEDRHARALALGEGQRLGHLLGTNGLFCGLTSWARNEVDAELIEWWSERRCATEWGEVVRPDGFGTIRVGTRSIEFFVEYDNGTEPLGRLGAKCSDYGDLTRATGWRPWVLFSFHSTAREAEARTVLSHPDVAIATTARDHFEEGPGGAVWLPVDSTGWRCSLVELSSAAGSRA